MIDYLITLIELEAEVLAYYSAELWTGTKAALGVLASLSLADRANPLTLIFEGAAGRGKSTIVNMFTPIGENSEFMYRLDAFTPKSFVTHAANVPNEQREEIDLLPKLKDKLLVTKELAPLFRGREEALRENFATLTAVLDGKGLRSASGVHGTRGYEGEYIFNWIGATTPIQARTDTIMAQLGNRLVRYEIVGEEESLEDLIAFAEKFQPARTEDRCRELVNRFASQFFKAHPVGSVRRESIQTPKDSLVDIVRLAQLTAAGRVELTTSDNGDEWVKVGEPEGPHRIILLLRTLASGLALLDEHPSVNADVMNTIRHVAFSSIPKDRRKTLRAVLANGGKIDSLTLEGRLNVSRPTARRMLLELAATGICEHTTGSGREGNRISLAEHWVWLLPPDAESETQVCAEGIVEI